MYARDHALIATPIGPIRIEGKEGHLERITIGAEGPPSRGSADAVRMAAEQLEQWFAGERRALSYEENNALIDKAKKNW